MSQNAVNGLTASSLVNLAIEGDTDLNLGTVSDGVADAAPDTVNVINASFAIQCG